MLPENETPDIKKRDLTRGYEINLLVMKPNIFFKSILMLTGLLIQGLAYSQMYVKDSYVYVSNQYVFLKSDLELNTANSLFYLRKEGQLIQGTTGSGTNKGLGSLSVFQEGTVNNYAYNYWCSPVGSTVAAAGNSLFGITQLGAPTTTTVTLPATMLAMSNFDGISANGGNLSIAPRWIWKFSTNGLYSDWVSVGSSTTIAAGEGFTMKGVSGSDNTIVDGVTNNSGSNQRYDFRGKPNDGDITIPVLLGELTLTGNPYPSAIDLSAFLIDATNSTGIAYFWDSDKTVNSHYTADYKGGYGTFSPVARGGSGIYIPADFYTYDGAGNEIPGIVGTGGTYERKYSPIGQGFFIEGLVSGNVTMKNLYRTFVKEGVSNNSQFERKANSKSNAKIATTDAIPQIRINTLLNNGPVRQTVLAFSQNATDGYDRAMDAKLLDDELPANNYFFMDTNRYVIDVVPFDIDKKIAIGFSNIAEANYKIMVNEMLNIPEVTNVFLHDKTTGLYHDIKNSFYDLTLAAGVYNTQFEITFKSDNLGIDETKNQNFEVRQDNTNKNLIVENPLHLEVTNCNLYDVVGRHIFTKTNLGTNSSYTFATSHLSNGIYIVKLSSNGKTEMGQKIIVKN